MENELLRHPVATPFLKRVVYAMQATLCLLLLSATITCTAQVRSVKSGNWHDATTWENNRIPGAADAVQIAYGHLVTVTGQAVCATVDVFPPHNSSSIEFSELALAQGATLQATTITLNPRNDRRYASFVNDGAIVTAATLRVGNGCILENVTGTIAVTGDVINYGEILTTAAQLEVGGSYLVGNRSIFAAGTGTVKYAATGTTPQTIASLPYHHLQIAGANTKVPAAALTITGDLTIENGSTFRAGNFTHVVSGNLTNYGTLESETATPTAITIGKSFINNGTTTSGAATYTIAGNWVNNGTFQPATSTIILEANTPQQLSGSTTFYNLHYRGTSQANLLSDITITNGISISNSHFNTGTSAITLGPDAAFTMLETDAAHVIGTVKTSRLLTPAAQESFGNIGLTLTRNEVDPGMITVERLTGVTTEISGTQSITRQYDISRSGTNDITTLAMTMDLAFLPKELQSKPLTEFKLYNKNRNNEAMPVQSTVLNQTTMRYANSNRFGIYTLAPPITPLPVELVWFKAAKQAHTVSLQWKTASEQDNEGFEVQVSADGTNYRTIAFVPSKSGNSSIAQLYSYTDNNPDRNTTLYYRLKQVDYSGKYSFSKSAAVSEFQGQIALQAAPNPFTDQISFAGGNTPVHVTITDLNGKAVLNQELLPQQRNAEGFYQLNTSQLQSRAMYLLTVQTPDQVYQAKLLKQ